MSISLKNIGKPIMIALALILLYANIAAKLGFDWWSDENYSHGLLVPFVIGYMIWLESDRLKKAIGDGSSWIGIAGIALSIFILFAGTLGAELFLQRISLVLMVASLLLYFFGVKLLKSLIFPFLIFLLSIPIPQIIFNKIAFPLQIIASKIAIWGIRVLEVPSVRNGNVIEILPQGATQIVSLEVVEACSGIRSLMTLVTLAVVLAYFTKEDSGRGRPFYRNSNFYQTLILIASAIPIAVVTNSLRVTATGVLTHYYGKQMVTGFAHELSGWLVYLVALILLIGVNIIYKRFAPKGEGPGEAFNESSPSIKTPRFYPVLASILLASLFINWFATRGEAEISRNELRELPASIGNWKRRGSDIRFSEQTESVLRASDYVMREYEADGMVTNLYIGYYASQRNGATYHSPQNCLPGSGWEMKEPELISIPRADGKEIIANKFLIENGSKREIMIYWYEGRGRSNPSEYTDKIFTVFDSAIRRRSDGAMVRILIPAGNDPQKASQSAINLASNLSSVLPQFVPE